MESKYLHIPGFERYRIHRETREVQSIALGNRWKPIKAHRNGLVRIISNDRTQEYAGRPIRILYAALRGINPAKISRDLVVIEHNGELQLLDRRALAERIQATRKAGRSKTVATAEYKAAIDFCACVLRAYQTDDYTEVVTRIWQEKPQIDKFMRTRNISHTEEGINEIWMEAFDITLSHIRNNGAFIANLPAYLRRIVSTIHAKRIKVNKILRSYDNPETKLARII